jgi:serine/threonine-protein kinase
VPVWASTILVVSVLLLALGYWTYRAVEGSLRELRAESMKSLLDSEVSGLRFWAAQEKADAARMAREPGVREILQAARVGDSGDAFAFDAGGTILTGERSGQVTPLRASVDEGAVLEPYVNHRGATVIGAARWLPEYGMGVGIEMDANEAYAPLRYLQIAFGAVFAALAIAVFAALWSARSVITLRREIGETRRLGAYVLQRRIGEGGMANVYLARHALLKRPTAVKLLKPARATDEMIARFEREVQLASSLSHPNTVEIFDFGRTRDGLFYYAMEYLDGLNVSEVIARSGALPVSRTIHVLRQACAALAEAHGKGLVHRDVKPENVMMCRYGGAYDFVKILDFGLVKSVGTKHSRDLTRNLRILGTPLYMAPERLRNPADVDGRADIYAVGALAYLMLTGRNMLEAADDLEMTSRILNEEPARVSAVAPQEVPQELDLVVTACVEKRREDRPQRIADLVEAFEALGADFPWTQREAQAWWNKLPERELA